MPWLTAPPFTKIFRTRWRFPSVDIPGLIFPGMPMKFLVQYGMRRDFSLLWPVRAAGLFASTVAFGCAFAQAPQDLKTAGLVVTSDLDIPGVQLAVGYKDPKELETAVPGNHFSLNVYLTSSKSMNLPPLRPVDDRANGSQVFQPRVDSQHLNRPSPDKQFYTSEYDITVDVTKVAEPRRWQLRLEFGPTHSATISIPVGMSIPTKADDPNYVLLRTPPRVDVNAFGTPNTLEFTIDNKFYEYPVNVTGYRVENSDHLVVGEKKASHPGEKLLEVPHGRSDTLPVPVSADAWRALWVADSNPKMQVTVTYTDGYRSQAQIFPADLSLPFRLTYHPLFMLSLCLLGAMIGALFRSKVPALSPEVLRERRWPRSRRIGVWVSRSILALLTGFVAWVLSYSVGIELAAKSVAIISAKTPYGALIIGILVGITPPSTFGGWIYKKLTGEPLPEVDGGRAPAAARGGGS